MKADHCLHDRTFNVRLGFDGDLFYSCVECGLTVRINEQSLKRHIRSRLRKEEAKRAKQEQSAG